MPKNNLKIDACTQEYFDFNTSKASLGVYRIYTKQKVLNIFFNDILRNIRGDTLEPINNCLDSLHIGRRHEQDHDLWHLTSDDHHRIHTHLMKNNGESFTPRELKCLLNNVVKFDRKLKSDLRAKGHNQVCSESDCKFYGKDWDHLLHRADRNDALRAYRRYYSACENRTEERQTDELKSEHSGISHLQDIPLEEMAKSCLSAFFDALVQGYLKPLLMDRQGQSHHKVTWACDTLMIAKNMLLTHSLLRTGIEYALPKIMNPILKITGFNAVTADAVVNSLGALLLVMQNPLNVVELTSNSASALLGQMMAWQVIRLLPKLRAEPPVVEKISDQARPEEIANGLRRVNRAT